MQKKLKLKRTILLLLMIVLSVQIKAQVIIGNTTYYDTVLVYTPQQFVGYPMVMDDLKMHWLDSAYWPLDPDNPCNCSDDYHYANSWVDYSYQYKKLTYLALKNKFCKSEDEIIHLPNSYLANVLGKSDLSNGFAQPYHLEDSAIVGGVALYCVWGGVL